MSGRADTPVVRRLTAGDAAALRQLRLQALADAPAAFASNHADEAALGDDHWQRLAAASELGDESAIVVAVERSQAGAAPAPGSTQRSQGGSAPAAASEPASGSTVAAVGAGGAGERLIGMAGGRWLDADRAIAQLWGLWVAPSGRQVGVGAGLVGAIRSWAADGGARFVRLGVIEPGGERLRRFYASLGFVELDDPVPMRIDPSRHCTFMARPV